MTALSHPTNTTAPSGAILPFVIPLEKHRRAEGNQLSCHSKFSDLP